MKQYRYRESDARNLKMSAVIEKVKRCLNLEIISYIMGAVTALLSIVALGWSIDIMSRYDSPAFQADKNIEGSLASIPFRGFVIAFLFAAFTLFVSVLMLRGIYLNHENYVMPFVMWVGLLVGIACIRPLLAFITGTVHGENMTSVLTYFFITFAEAAVGLLLFLPVYIFYLRMDTQPYYPAIMEKV